MVEYDRTPPNPNANQALRICIAGVGGAGSNVLDRITIDRSVDAKLVTFQTDIRVLNRTNVLNRVQLGTELMRGVGAGGDPDLGREAALFSKNDIRDSLEGHDMVFISAGLGGGTGSGAAPVVAEIAKSTGAIVVVFATVPFSFEGRRRGTQAAEALERLAKSADALILFDNNRMGELILPKEGIQKAFAQGDQLISQSVRAVTSMVGAPGLVKLGLDDLVAALRVSEGRCLFGFGEAKGQNRGTEALKRALKSPLINSGELLSNAKNLLVHVVGGESLTLAEVEQVMKQLGRHVPDETQILFGLSVEPKLGETITVTLMSALSAVELASARPPQEEQKPVEVAKPARQPAAVVPRPAPAPAPVAAPAPAPALPAVEDLFVSTHDPVPAPAPVAVHREPEPAPAPAPRPAPRPAPVAAAAPAPAPVYVAPAPAPAPAPVAPVHSAPPLTVARMAEEVVYQADEPEEEEEEIAPAPPPVRETTRVRLMSVINSEKSTSHAEVAKAHQPVVDEVDFQPEPAPEILAPVPETVQVSVRPRHVEVRPEPVMEQPAPMHRAPVAAELAHEEPRAADLFATREPAPVSAPAPAKKPLPPVEQQSLRLGSDDRGARFKDTEPSFATQGNEDLDTPTWMRLRRRATK